MGPHLTFHLAGGEGGMKHSWITSAAFDLGLDGRSRPDTTYAALVQKAIIDGVAEEAEGWTIAELQRWRDRKLIDILKVSGEP